MPPATFRWREVFFLAAPIIIQHNKASAIQPSAGPFVPLGGHVPCLVVWGVLFGLAVARSGGGQFKVQLKLN